MHAGNFEGPRASVDSVVFQLIGDELFVLLIKRASDPFAGQWALPGSYCSGTETIGESMRRALAEKAGISKE
ncbi:MAG TPA: NUDIX domain-containing protein, partial [Candidatus Saccharibacteria bacterium]|nr:NUDIX domain-containing protein [Candidatus Saccharibacteria bacterium]